MARIPFHPLANIFPLIEGEDYEALVADIKANGLADSIVTHEGKILDGRNRYNACLDADAEPTFAPWAGSCGTPLSFVLSVNLHRRHLTTSQRAMVADNLTNLSVGQQKANAQICAFEKDAKSTGNTPVSQGDAAQALKVSRGAVQAAAKVHAKGAKKLIEAVETGKVSVSAAAKIAEQPKPQQVKALKQVAEPPKPLDKKAEVRARCDKIIKREEANFKDIEWLEEACGADDKFVRECKRSIDKVSQAMIDLKRAKR